MSSKPQSNLIHQALHGYREGHSLLVSSFSLDAVDRRKMMIYSDLSGPSFVSGFDSYIQAYSLPSSKAVVFSKTWSATELPRPGCVWTHSLIIPSSEIPQVVDLKALTHFFDRPNVAEPFKKYETTLIFEPNDQERAPAFSDLNLVFFEKYFDPNSSQLILLSDSNSEFENSVLNCWPLVWATLKNSIELTTGLLGPRQIEQGSFRVAIAPKSTKRLIDRGQGITFVSADEISGRKEKSDIEASVSVNDLQQFSLFVGRFGEDIAPDRTLEPKVLDLSKQLSSHVSNLDQLISDLQAVATPKPGNSLVSHIFDRNVNEFPALDKISESAILYYAIAKLEPGARAGVSSAIPKRISELANRNPSEAYDLLRQLLRTNNLDETGVRAAVDLYYHLLRNSDLGKFEVHDRLVEAAFRSYPDLWELPQAWRELSIHSGVIDSVLSDSNFSDDKRMSLARRILGDLGNSGLRLAMYLLDALSFEEVLSVLSSSGKVDFNNQEFRNFLRRNHASLGRMIVQSGNYNDQLLTAFIADSSLENDADFKVIWPMISTRIKNAEWDTLPQEMVVFALAKSFASRARLFPEVIQSSYSHVYSVARSNKLSPLSADLISRSTAKPYFWNGWDQCARLRVTLLTLLQAEAISAGLFVAACGRADILRDVLKESESFLFTDRRPIKQTLKKFLKNTENIPAEAAKILEQYVDEKWGW